MDIQATEQRQSISDDQELAKVLAGIDDTKTITDVNNESSSSAMPTPSTPMPSAPSDGDSNDQVPVKHDPIQPVQPMPTAPAGDDSLEAIKQQALGALRPLVDKLDVSNEEKFDTYLLLLRSTDDKELITPAYAAASSIEDEARRAAALLDIIKEIDFLSQSQK